MVPLSAFITWFLTRNKNQADLRKIQEETRGTHLDVQMKEHIYQNERYDKLLERVAEQDKLIERLSKENRRLAEAFDELRAELSIYKTISNK